MMLRFAAAAIRLCEASSQFFPNPDTHVNAMPMQGQPGQCVCDLCVTGKQPKARARSRCGPTSEDAYSVHHFSSAESEGVEAEDFEGFLVASACKP